MRDLLQRLMRRDDSRFPPSGERGICGLIALGLAGGILAITGGAVWGAVEVVQAIL